MFKKMIVFKPCVNDLISAIIKKDIKLVHKILLKSPNLAKPAKTIDDETPITCTPFWLAVIFGYEKIVEFLVKFGVNGNEPYLFETNNFYKFSFLQCLASLKTDWEQHRKVAETLMKLGVKADSYPKIMQVTPLQIAIVEENPSYAEFLLKNGAKLQGATWDQVGLIKLIVQTKKPNQGKLFQLLLEHGLDPQFHDDKGRNLLQLVILFAEIVKNPDILEIVEILLAAGVPVDAMDSLELTPLIHALQFNNIDLLKFMVEAGADVNIRAGQGVFPLYFAVYYNHVEVVKFLLSKGADVNARTDSGATVLALAYNKEFKEMTKLLINEGADVNVKLLCLGYFPLHHAALNNDVEECELLLSNDADVNAQTDSGDTPLHIACHRMHDEIINLLIEHGAEISPLNHSNVSPLYCLLTSDRRENNPCYIKCVHAMIGEIARLNFIRDDSVSVYDMDTVRTTPPLARYFEKCMKKHFEETIRDSFKPYYLNVSFAKFLLQHGINPFRQSE